MMQWLRDDIRTAGTGCEAGFLVCVQALFSLTILSDSVSKLISS